VEDKKQVNPEEETVNEEVKEEGEAEILEEKADAKKEPEKKSKKQTKKQKDEEIEALKLEVEAMKEKMLRNQAELQNFKRRMNDERIKERKFANAEFAKSLLPILDNFDLALQKEKESSNLKGFEMIQRDLLAALKENGLEEVSALNEPFDPNYHQAVMKEEKEGVESNIVIEVFQKGYVLKDRLIRPAMVKVSE